MRPPSQGWRTFLRNHAPDIAAMDLFVVPTIGFDLLYALVIVRLARRDLVWINVTTHPTADWIARQITEAFPWAKAPRYVIRDLNRKRKKLPVLTILEPAGELEEPAIDAKAAPIVRSFFAWSL